MSSPEINPALLSQTINPWYLGADPEFAVVTPPRKTILNAGVTAVQFKSDPGEIGYDHGGRVWEARPSPSTTSYGLVLNLWRLFRDERFKPVEQFKWKSGALGGGDDTLGGHVHFGIRALNNNQILACNALTRALLEMDVLPRKENMTRIEQGSYGSFNSRVTESSHGHIEYRPAPSWLDKPGQAFAVLTSFKLAAARPSSCGTFHTKPGYLNWIEACAREDVDAFLLDRFINVRGFPAIQADPDQDFKPNWRKEDLWAK